MSAAVYGSLACVGLLLIVAIAALTFSIITFAFVRPAPAPTLAPFAPGTEQPMPPRTSPPPPTNSAWQNITNMFIASINESVDPCQDFQQFSCGNWIKNHQSSPQISFGTVDNTIISKLSSVLSSGTNQTSGLPWLQTSYAADKAQKAFTACINSDPKNADTAKAEIAYIVKLVNTNGGWPMAQKTWSSNKPPFQLAGLLAAKYRVPTFITPQVDTDWKNPTKQLLQLYQATLAMPTSTYYTPAVWNTTKARYAQVIRNMTVWLTKNAKYSQPDSTILSNDIQDILDLEYYLAQISVRPTAERDATKLYHPYHCENSPLLVEMSQFISSMNNALDGFVTPSSLCSFNLPETAYWNQLQTYIQQKKDKGVGNYNRLMQNYLIFRLLYSRANFMPGISTVYEDFVRETGQLEPNAVQEHQAYCVNLIRDTMPYVAGRVYVDFHFNQLPGNPRDKLQSMISSVLGAFRNMLSGLSWMDERTKLVAINKVNGLLQNVAYPDWILNNTALDGYVIKMLEAFTPQSGLFAVSDLLNLYQSRFTFAQLQYPTDRRNFLGSPAIVNAWYQPELNSITFPAGILNPPFFQADWPASVNYGAMGVVMGHELTHGFDDQGVQWDPVGLLNPWLKGSNVAGFKKMAQCVIDEYNKFCFNFQHPKTTRCVNGVQTQGENIADNGGIKSAYLAFKNGEFLNGVQDRLPGAMAKYTHDQLYFMAFGQVWCRTIPYDNILRQLLNDPHSPARDRILGTVQNFPAFGKAFNCRKGQPMYPTSHCNVW